MQTLERSLEIQLETWFVLKTTSKHSPYCNRVRLLGSDPQYPANLVFDYPAKQLQKQNNLTVLLRP